MEECILCTSVCISWLLFPEIFTFSFLNEAFEIDWTMMSLPACSNQIHIITEQIVIRTTCDLYSGLIENS